MKTFGEQVREARDGSGLSQEQLARRANVGVRTVTRIEHDAHEPTLKTMVAIAKEFPYFAFTFEGGNMEVTIVATRKGGMNKAVVGLARKKAGGV
jgi:transcriptional regulator with XRE-family HTH domain